MIPTNYLRQVPTYKLVDYVGMPDQYEEFSGYKLQQWWVESGFREPQNILHAMLSEPGKFKGQWRDVDILSTPET